MSEFTEIPILDVSSIYARDPAGQTDLMQAFASAYGETGFGYIVNHGIDEGLINAVFAASQAFHELPMERKMAVELDHKHRGYIPINTSTDVNSQLADVTKPNQSASFMMMREDTSEDSAVYLSGPNQWPDLAGFREVLETYNAHLTDLGGRLMKLALGAIGVDADGPMQMFDTPTTWLRLLHYPPGPEASPEGLYGSAPHTDFGCLTILAQDRVGGLQVRTPRDVWVDAPYIPGSFVVNVGDMLRRMSNGRLLSTPHRVINRSGQERFSVPFFFDPHVSADIAPLPGTGAPAFEPVNFGEFLHRELEAGYDKHKGPGETGA